MSDQHTADVFALDGTPLQNTITADPFGTVKPDEPGFARTSTAVLLEQANLQMLSITGALDYMSPDDVMKHSVEITAIYHTSNFLSRLLEDRYGIKSIPVT